jgi:hypothetical protein
VDLEYTLSHASGAVRYKADTNVLASNTTYTRTFTGAIGMVGIDIDGNTSNAITFEVLTAKR